MGAILKVLIGGALIVGLVTDGNALIDVTVNRSVEHQEILGWGASSWCPPHATQALRNEIVREAVNDLGLTRLRLELPSGNRTNSRRWEWLNDDGDPHSIDWTGFNTSALDDRLPEIVIPFKQCVEANGEHFEVYVSPSFFNSGSTGEVPAWLLHSPGEYSEFATSVLLHLRNVHGISADYYCICNEAGNNNYFSAQVVGRMIRTLGPWFAAAGLPAAIQFPECVSASASWNYIQALQGDTLVWPHVGAVTYHLYGTNDPYRSYIRDFAHSRGLPTGQTEYMNLTMDHMYDDLTLGGVSYWEVYGQGQWIRPNYDETSFSRSNQYWNFRQVMHYVRPGHVRIDATSSDPSISPLAFADGSSATLVLRNIASPQQPCTVDVYGLPRGRYGVCQSMNSGVYQEIGPRVFGGSSPMRLLIPANTVLTVYSLPRTNQAPSATEWSASPSYLILPASSTTLSASATDPELDSIAYAWSVTAEPPGASVNLATPDSSRTSATGLTVPGQYVFMVSVDDGIHTVTRDVVLNAHASNQPPGVDDVHNRIPVMITLPVDSTHLRAWAWDLEGDPLTYLWDILSQPPGANVTLTNPNTASCVANDMAVPGDYVFSLSVSDPTHTVAETLTVPVYPVNSAPLILSAGASPDSLTLPEDSTLLMATTNDPDGDIITHWWSVKSAPPGASPVFAKQGWAQTTVSNLTVAGSYIFTLTVVDMTKFTARDVGVDVMVGVCEYGTHIQPKSFELFQNEPNPFSVVTEVSFALPRRSRASISIYDIEGRLVRVLLKREAEAGVHHVCWNGRDHCQRELPSGIYFCRFIVPGEVAQTRKILLLR